MIRIQNIYFILFTLFSCSQQKNDSKVDTTISSDSVVSIKTPKSTIEVPCSYENPVSTLGIGLVLAPTKFKIFNDSLLTSLHGNWDMYNDYDSINTCSKFYKPDYGIMQFVCIAITPKAYKVLVNFSVIKYLPKEENYTFIPWERYILESFGIRRITAGSGLSTSSLKKEPSDTADTLAIPNGHEMFCAMEIRGEWVKVIYDCFYNDEHNKNEGEPCHNFINECKDPLTGWIRWRKDNTCLIDIFLMP